MASASSTDNVRRAIGAFGLATFFVGGAVITAWILLSLLLLGPALFWVAWDLLGLAESMNLPELGLWATVLATMFLVVGFFGKTVITAVAFVVQPDWLDATAEVSWPDPSLKNFAAIAILAALASAPHKHSHSSSKRT